MFLNFNLSYTGDMCKGDPVTSTTIIDLICDYSEVIFCQII